MTKRIHGKYPKGTRMRSLELATELPEQGVRGRDWDRERRCKCPPRRRRGPLLMGGQTPSRVYAGNWVCARCERFIWVHGTPEWN